MLAPVASRDGRERPADPAADVCDPHAGSQTQKASHALLVTALRCGEALAGASRRKVERSAPSVLIKRRDEVVEATHQRRMRTGAVRPVRGCVRAPQFAVLAKRGSEIIATGHVCRVPCFTARHEYLRVASRSVTLQVAL